MHATARACSYQLNSALGSLMQRRQHAVELLQLQEDEVALLLQVLELFRVCLRADNRLNTRSSRKKQQNYLATLLQRHHFTRSGAQLRAELLELVELRRELGAVLLRGRCWVHRVRALGDRPVVAEVHGGRRVAQSLLGGAHCSVRDGELKDRSAPNTSSG